MTEAPSLAQPQASYSGSSQAAAPQRLFDSFGMNPRIVRFYLAEKGIDVPRHEVDILGAENRQTDFLSTGIFRIRREPVVFKRESKIRYLFSVSVVGK